jgi:dihydrolipoamide dehydrogenase
MKVAVVEKRATHGGTCLNIGCIPSKALLHASEVFEEAGHTFDTLGIKIAKPKLELDKMMGFKDDVVKDNVDGIAYLIKKNKITDYIGTGKPSPGRARSR